MNITIHGTEKNKSEIIYNNIVETMKELNLSEAEQIEYLKTKVTALETEIHSKILMILTILAGIIGIGLGLYFVAINQYFFGIVLSFGTMAMMLYRIYVILKQHLLMKKDTNYEKIEQLRKMLHIRLK